MTRTPTCKQHDVARTLKRLSSDKDLENRKLGASGVRSFLYNLKTCFTYFTYNQKFCSSAKLKFYFQAFRVFYICVLSTQYLEKCFHLPNGLFVVSTKNRNTLIC